MKKKKIKEIPFDKAPDIVDELLRLNLSLPGLNSMVIYARLHDESMGEDEGRLNVTVAHNGDTYVWIDTGARQGTSLCFKSNILGGGQSPHTRNALLILARAILLDNNTHPLNNV